MSLRFTINGVNREVDAHPMRRLLDVLREDLRLTGTKEGCGEGECGACSVIVDGLARDGRIDPLQHAFLECGGSQCGICTPGMLIAARALLDGNARPTKDEIKEGIAGNLCRCTGYARLIDAIE